MLTQESQDLHHELGSTRSVRASVTTFATSLYQRLDTALKADNGRGDMAALAAIRDDLAPDHREALAGSIAKGTVAASADEDVDPSAPPPASNPGSLGGNVYGSKGPEDSDTQRNSSAGYAGRDQAMGTRFEQPPANNDRVAPGAEKFDDATPPTAESHAEPANDHRGHSATEVGGGTPAQDAPAGTSPAAREDAEAHT